jgi:hypothetical protein
MINVLAIVSIWVPTLMFFSFEGIMLSICLWMLHGLKKERAKKRPIGFVVTSGPESRSRSAE